MILLDSIHIERIYKNYAVVAGLESFRILSLLSSISEKKQLFFHAESTFRRRSYYLQI